MTRLILSFVFLVALIPTALKADNSRLDSLIRRGIEVHNSGDYHSAIRTYSEALQEFPGESVLHYELAVSYFALGAYEKALEHINRVKEPTGQYEKESVLLKSSILEALYKYDTAEKLLKEALKKYSNNSLFHYNLAHVYYSQEEDNNAILSLIDALKVNPTHSNSHFLMGRIFSKHIRKTESILAYYYFLLVEPSSPKSKISLKLIDNLIGLGVTKKNNDSLNAEIYISPDTTNVFAEADILLSLTATNYKVSHFDNDTDDEILVAKMVAFFSILEKISKENKNSGNFMIDFYAKFFIDMHKANHTETFCRYIRQSVSKSSLLWLKTHNREVKAFEEWLNNYYTK